MKIAADNIDEFFAACGQYEPVMRELDMLIRRNAPGLAPLLVGGMSITMLGYGMTPYTYASGKSGEWPLIAIAPQKNYASLYLCATTKQGEYYAEAHKERLGKVSCGKSCIRFKKPEDLNTVTVAELVREIASRHSTGETMFGM